MDLIADALVAAEGRADASPAVSAARLFTIFNVFRYITFHAGASLTAMA